MLSFNQSINYHRNKNKAYINNRNIHIQNNSSSGVRDGGVLTIDTNGFRVKKKKKKKLSKPLAISVLASLKRRIKDVSLILCKSFSLGR